MDRRVEKTKQAIQTAYFDLLTENKSTKITVSEIARRANIDRKTFYLHYNTTEDIIRNFCKKEVDELRLRLKAAESKGHPFSINLLFDTLTQLISEDLSLFEIVSTGNSADYFFDELRHLLINVILKDYNHYFKFSETELRIYAEFYMSGIISTYNLWINNKLPLPINDLAALVSNAAIKGLDKLIASKQ